MGETGSISASPCPNPPAICEIESTAELLALPPDILTTILESLPTRCLPAVRLVCRKLEIMVGPIISKISMKMESKLPTKRLHRLLRFNGQRDLTVRQGTGPIAFNAAPPLGNAGSDTSSSYAPPAVPSWAPYVCELQLQLRAKPQPTTPYSQPAQAAQLEPGLLDGEDPAPLAIDPPAAAVAPNHAIQIDLQLPAHNIHVQAPHLGPPAAAAAAAALPHHHPP
ncbi:hypothetical protein Agub_g8398, partial [Astrephomene gubernaculifera]